MISRWLRTQKPIAHAEKVLEYVEKALSLVHKRISTYPVPEMYLWLAPQIKYIKSVLTESNADRSKLHKIDFGTAGQAGETLEMSDPELFEILSGLSYIIEQIDDGLEIDLQELENSLKRLSTFTTNKTS